MENDQTTLTPAEQRLAAELDAMGRHERGIPDGGFEARIAHASLDALQGGPTLRIVDQRGGAKALPRWVWGGVAVAACVVLAVVWNPPATAPGPKDSGLASAATMEDDVTVMLAAIDSWENGLGEDVDVAMATATGLASELGARGSLWPSEWTDEGAM